MFVITKKTCLSWGVGGLLVSLCALGPSGCSDSSAGPSGTDASSDVQADALGEAGASPPLGVPVATCAGCPVCGGVLGSATTGITYCTQVCTATTDCPAGTGCVMNSITTSLPNQCIKTCTSDADCTAPFICRSDLPTPGNYCWSPFPPVAGSASDAGDAAVAVPDSGTDTGAPADAGSDSGTADAAPSDAAVGD